MSAAKSQPGDQPASTTMAEDTATQDAAPLDDFTKEDLTLDLSAIDRQYASSPPETPRRIHLLGTGSIGKLVAHSLRGIPNPPPITLILHRYKLVETWQKSKKVITIEDDGFKVERDGFDVELQQEVRRRHGVELEDGQPDVYESGFESRGVRPHEAAHIMERQGQEGGVRTADSKAPQSEGDKFISSEPIHNLIVTTKAPLTVTALSSVRHRLSSTSTICFLQNGMGIIDDVNKHLFPVEEERPNYVQGIISHGANVPPEVAARDPFFAVHAGHGTIALGLLPRADSSSTSGEAAAAESADAPDANPRGKRASKTQLWAPSARYLLRTLTRTPVLCAVGFAPTELLQLQLEKLAVNSILNPLTSLIDARNGNILYNFALTRTMRLMLAETSLVFRSLPELKGVPNVNTRFSPERLETLVVSVSNKTKDNISSMLADVRAGRRTEIEYINGYIVRRGEELGIKCVVNYAIMQTIIGKSVVVEREGRDVVPVAGVRDMNAGAS